MNNTNSLKIYKECLIKKLDKKFVHYPNQSKRLKHQSLKRINKLYFNNNRDNVNTNRTCVVNKNDTYLSEVRNFINKIIKSNDIKNKEMNPNITKIKENKISINPADVEIENKKKPVEINSTEIDDKIKENLVLITNKTIDINVDDDKNSIVKDQGKSTDKKNSESGDINKDISNGNTGNLKGLNLNGKHNSTENSLNRKPPEINPEGIISKDIQLEKPPSNSKYKSNNLIQEDTLAKDNKNIQDNKLTELKKLNSKEEKNVNNTKIEKAFVLTPENKTDQPKIESESISKNNPEPISNNKLIIEPGKDEKLEKLADIKQNEIHTEMKKLSEDIIQPTIIINNKNITVNISQNASINKSNEISTLNHNAKIAEKPLKNSKIKNNVASMQGSNDKEPDNSKYQKKDNLVEVKADQSELDLTERSNNQQIDKVIQKTADEPKAIPVVQNPIKQSTNNIKDQTIDNVKNSSAEIPSYQTINNTTNIVVENPSDHKPVQMSDKIQDATIIDKITLNSAMIPINLSNNTKSNQASNSSIKMNHKSNFKPDKELLTESNIKSNDPLTSTTNIVPDKHNIEESKKEEANISGKEITLNKNISDSPTNLKQSEVKIENTKSTNNKKSLLEDNKITTHNQVKENSTSGQLEDKDASTDNKSSEKLMENTSTINQIKSGLIANGKSDTEVKITNNTKPQTDGENIKIEKVINTEEPVTPKNSTEKTSENSATKSNDESEEDSEEDSSNNESNSNENSKNESKNNKTELTKSYQLETNTSASNNTKAENLTVESNHILSLNTKSNSNSNLTIANKEEVSNITNITSTIDSNEKITAPEDVYHELEEIAKQIEINPAESYSILLTFDDLFYDKNKSELHSIAKQTLEKFKLNEERPPERKSKIEKIKFNLDQRVPENKTKPNNNTINDVQTNYQTSFKEIFYTLETHIASTKKNLSSELKKNYLAYYSKLLGYLEKIQKEFKKEFQLNDDSHIEEYIRRMKLLKVFKVVEFKGFNMMAATIKFSQELFELLEKIILNDVDPVNSRLDIIKTDSDESTYNKTLTDFLSSLYVHFESLNKTKIHIEEIKNSSNYKKEFKIDILIGLLENYESFLIWTKTKHNSTSNYLEKLQNLIELSEGIKNADNLDVYKLIYNDIYDYYINIGNKLRKIIKKFQLKLSEKQAMNVNNPNPLLIVQSKDYNITVNNSFTDFTVIDVVLYFNLVLYYIIVILLAIVYYKCFKKIVAQCMAFLINSFFDENSLFNLNIILGILIGDSILGFIIGTILFKDLIIGTIFAIDGLFIGAAILFNGYAGTAYGFPSFIVLGILFGYKLGSNFPLIILVILTGAAAFGFGILGNHIGSIHIIQFKSKLDIRDERGRKLYDQQLPSQPNTQPGLQTSFQSGSKSNIETSYQANSQSPQLSNITPTQESNIQSNQPPQKEPFWVRLQKQSQQKSQSLQPESIIQIQPNSQPGLQANNQPTQQQSNVQPPQQSQKDPFWVRLQKQSQQQSLPQQQQSMIQPGTNNNNSQIVSKLNLKS